MIVMLNITTVTRVLVTFRAISVLVCGVKFIVSRSVDNYDGSLSPLFNCSFAGNPIIGAIDNSEGGSVGD
jgi:hypothetical protein